ncbi:MAG: aspartyl/glutamyl-tRNA(Asn/Gln) amidotransferase subunit [Proteobacteria bacterium]|nr:aspartyl/glutamyl-tRNA(Asn/Gln) amidotransferase subunit [Pseudomonadota bacterium]
MSLTQAQIHRIALLSRIAVSDEEATATRSHLDGIFSLIEEMQAVDTKGVEPMAHAQDVCQRLRQDAVSESDQRDLFQNIAPEVENGLYLVPKVIE